MYTCIIITFIYNVFNIQKFIKNNNNNNYKKSKLLLRDYLLIFFVYKFIK